MSKSQLREEMRECRLIRFSRPFENLPIRGYVQDIGPRFFLLALVSDRIWFDGFECFRIDDIYDVRVDRFVAFAESALKKRGEKMPSKPRVDLTSVDKVLESAGREFPLVTIHREEINSSVCHIGHVIDIKDGKVSLLEIGPDAKWDRQAIDYRLSEITRVNFGGDYEEALYLVGGEPPIG